MKGLKLFKRDMNLGVFRRLFMYVVPIFIAYMQSNECHKVFQYMKHEGLLSSMGTGIDYLLYCTQGMFVFHFDPKEYFSIPIYWFLFQIYISYIIAYYASDDYNNYGKNLFLSVRNRSSWWNAKCLWCMVSVALYYIIYVFSVLAMASIFGANLKLSYTPEFVGSVFNANALALNIHDILLISIIIPFLVTIGLCLSQVFTGFIFTPVVSFAVVSGVYIVSAYYTEWWLPGSYTMWLRSALLTTEGVRPVSGIMFGVLMVFLAWYGGLIYFETKDVL